MKPTKRERGAGMKDQDGNESRMGGREEGEPPPSEAEEGGGKPRERGAESLGERPKRAGKKTGRGEVER